MTIKTPVKVNQKASEESMSESSLKPVEIDEMPPEIRTLIAQCEANVSNFNNDQMSAPCGSLRCSNSGAM